MPIVAGIIGTAIFTAGAFGLRAIWNEMKTPNGTLVADTDIAIESLNGETTQWYGGRGLNNERNGWMAQWKYDEDYSNEKKRKSHYEYWSCYIAYVQWDEDKEYYVTTHTLNRWGNIYFPSCINDAYNNGNHGDEDTGNTGYVIESGIAEMNHLSHVFDSQVNKWQADPDLEGHGFTYNPEVYANISDMRYDAIRNSNGTPIAGPSWIYTPRRDRTHKVASDMPADKSATQTVQILDLSSRLDSYEMRRNKSKLYWKRTKKEIPAGKPATVIFNDGSTMPTNTPVSSTWIGPLPHQKITTSN